MSDTRPVLRDTADFDPCGEGVVSVENGRDRMGFIEAVDGGYLARDAEGELIGAFPSKQEARSAVVRAAFGMAAR